MGFSSRYIKSLPRPALESPIPIHASLPSTTTHPTTRTPHIHTNNMSKIALVTGGSRGLGRSACLALAKRGVRVIFTYQSGGDASKKVIEEIKAAGSDAQALHLDVSKPDTIDSFVTDFKKALKEFGSDKFDYLLHNAGIASHSSVADSKPEDIDLIYNIHYKSVFLLTQKCIPLLNDGSRILLISTGLSRFTIPNSGMAIYSSMKGAIEVFTKYLAWELGPRGISVVCARTGAIETDFGGGAVRDNQAYNDRVKASIALGRVGQPEDIGPAYAALLSDDLKWVNGTVVEISGGQSI